jgi:monoamine oxidase
MLNLVSEVPCGTYEKVAIALDSYPFDPVDNEAIWLSPDRKETPIYFQILRGRQPMLIAHIAGQEARDLVREGPQEMVDFATHNLKKVFGSDIQKRVSGSAVTNWQTNPFIQGGYSYEKPGAGKNRQDMIALDTGLIAFAGEAFSLPWFGTAHGAYQSGRDVAFKLAKRLNSTRLS